MVQVDGGGTVVRFVPETARVTVRTDGTTLATGRVVIELGAERFPDTDAYHVETDADGTRVRYDDAAGTTVRLGEAANGVTLTVSVANETETPRPVGRLCPLAAEELSFGPETRLYRHGYQSWTPTAALPVAESFAPVEPVDVPMMTDVEAPRTTSHCQVGLTDGDRHLTAGFLDHSTYVNRFDYERGEGVESLTAVSPGDGVSLAPGERVASAPLWLDASRPVDDALAALAERTGERMNARVGEWVPTGWCSWYHYFTEVTADDVRTNRAELDEWGLPVELVQLDDGYQTAFGDWRTLADGFEEMSSLVADVRDGGYTPGLWLAPFFVQADADLVAAHPDWLVTDGDGEFVSAGERHGEMYGLDLTHPEVQTWLRETFRTVVDEWGFDYLKLDFLYAGALPGERFADVTRAEAYREGLATIREAVGEETHILGCGAPQGQSVGLVDTMRVGPDTAEYWTREGESDSEPAHENAIRNVLNRDYLHREWWLNDPDCQLVRETTELSAAEREAFATVVALTGGSNLFSDKIADIGAANRSLLERSLPPVTEGTVDGVGRTELPDRLVCERAADGGRAVALFNWSDSAETMSLSLADDERGWDAFEGEAISVGETVERTVPAHGCLLVHVAPASDRPHLLGTDNLAGLGSRLERVAWSADGSAGRLTLSIDAAMPQTVVIGVPDGWSDAADDGDTMDTRTVTVGPGTATLSFERA
ncbi:alpha-galactosidase [Haloarcula sp. S1CR25-12]|uniref:Alpha-galactosidase n=1 Tax=Haloarcula saliterrae TaxID=2950534 RepID=A0ABU2FDE8_9EURY|nr:alpha-galactosidase [Haloarcula sp. S1CR25-12]MDS0260292.1 alpha-galactosidase [Haloarcula sp. S1CR25-12]